MKQLWVRFDNGFQKLQSNLETHHSDHLGHSDPLRTPHMENTLKSTTMATLKKSGSVDQRGRGRAGRAEHCGCSFVGAKYLPAVLGLVTQRFLQGVGAPEIPALAGKTFECVHQQLPTDNMPCVLYCPWFNYRALLSLQKAFQNVKA